MFYYKKRKKREYKNGDEYYGNWLNDLKEGKEIMKYKNGDIYNGNWNNNKKEDNGKMKYKN